MKLYLDKRRRLCILAFIFFLVTGLAWPGQAQATLVVEKLHLSIWPEYYTPDVIASQAVLFVNRGEEPVSGEVWFQLPKSVEATDLIDVKQGMFPRYFEVVDKGDHQLVRYELPQSLAPGEQLPLVLEYRYPPFQEAGPRNIPVEFVSKYPVEELTVEIKQPLRATEFQLDPPAEEQFMDSEGFDVYRYRYTGLQAEERLAFRINYVKEDNLPSVDPMPAEVPTEEPQESSSLNKATVALLVVILLALFGLVLFIALRNNPSAREVVAGKKGAGSKGPKAGAAGKKANVAKEPQDPRKKLRKMLVEGRIDEKTYEKLMKELEKGK